MLASSGIMRCMDYLLSVKYSILGTIIKPHSEEDYCIKIISLSIICNYSLAVDCRL